MNTILPLLSRMQQRRSGQIAIFSSGAGFCAEPMNPIYSATKVALTAYGESLRYIMRDYNGRIAVFVYGEDEPQEIFDVFTSSLPRGEAERVYKGITVEGDEALQKLIEDFTG